MAAPIVTDKVISDAVAQYNVFFLKNINNLKPLQYDALNSLLTGKDCLCCLPTGYGKSLIYELLPFIVDNCFVIVIEPLNAIIKQQLTKLGDKASSLCKGQNIQNIIDDNKSYLFSHPEDILQNRDFINMFSSDRFKKKQLFLVVDEAHCIIDWGEEFRPEYNRLAQLRAVFQCQVLALSATVTNSGQRVITENLMMTDSKVVSASPAKDNITLIIKQRPSATAKGNNACSPYDYIFQPVLEELRAKLDSFPITIIYCKSVQWIGYGYELARRILGDHFYKDKQSPETVRVVMFHSSMEKGPGLLKEMILESLQKPAAECCIRLVISSVALGMGADLRHVSRVIHAGPPTTMETYVQEIGRAGREGKFAQAILYFNNNDLGIKHIRTEMKNYCRAQICLRELINEFFGFHTEQRPQLCCSLCQETLGIEWDFGKLTMS